MIAEWFYPKELKDIIADLRAKDDLNEGALKVLEHSPIVSVIIFGFVFVVVAFSLIPNWHAILIAGGACVVMGVVLMIITIFSSWSRMKAYLSGIKMKGEVVSVFPYVGVNPNVRIKMRSVSSGCDEIFPIGDYVEWHLDKKSCPQIGQIFLFYSTGRTTRHNMPDRLEIMKNYCLSKSMLKGES